MDVENIDCILGGFIIRYDTPQSQHSETTVEEGSKIYAFGDINDILCASDTEHDFVQYGIHKYMLPIKIIVQYYPENDILFY